MCMKVLATRFNDQDEPVAVETRTVYSQRAWDEAVKQYLEGYRLLPGDIHSEPCNS
jgi:hypothetical protein